MILLLYSLFLYVLADTIAYDTLYSVPGTASVKVTVYSSTTTALAISEGTLKGLGNSATTPCASYYYTPKATTTTEQVFDKVPEETLVVLDIATPVPKKEYNVEYKPVVIRSDDEGFSDIQNVDNKDLKIKEIKHKEVTMVRISGKDFCSAVGMSQFLANGTQQKFETCSLTVHGSLPSFNNMVSTVITSPENGCKFKLGFDTLSVVINSSGIEYGFFDDPASLYYFTPQSLNSAGLIKGHSHISITQIVNGVIPDPRKPLFFKGLNDPSSDGSLNVTVSGNIFKAPGIYRICTSTASQSHAPVLMPVAKRGFADDCIRIEITN